MDNILEKSSKYLVNKLCSEEILCCQQDSCSPPVKIKKVVNLFFFGNNSHHLSLGEGANTLNDTQFPKFVGVIFHLTFNWHQHIIITVKCELSSSIFASRRFCGKVDQDSLRQAYFWMFHSRLLYKHKHKINSRLRLVRPRLVRNLDGLFSHLTDDQFFFLVRDCCSVIVSE